MDPNNILFNALTVGPTNSGNTQFLVNKRRGPFRCKSDYMVLICPTFVHNKTYDRFVDQDSRIFVIVFLQEEVELWLKLSGHFFRARTRSSFWTTALPQKSGKAALASWALSAFLPAMQASACGF